jgi:hypothetical protein
MAIVIASEGFGSRVMGGLAHELEGTVNLEYGVQGVIAQ